MKKLMYCLVVGIVVLVVANACSVLQPYSVKKITPLVPEEYREKVIESLDEAGSNKKELLKVLYHYKDEPRKLEAASFLIAYMSDHSFVDVQLVDSLGVIAPLNVMDFETAAEVQVYVDSLEQELGELHYKLIERREDVEMVNAELLITHIDLAFLAYETLPWTHNYSWDDFREYILPYRGSSEPLSDWRLYFWDNFEPLRKDGSDPLEFAFTVNDSVRKIFSFKDVFYYHPTDQGLDEMLENGYGRCEDMTNFTIYAMRANGLAVCSDYTPFWPDRSNNHAWNAIVFPDGEVIPFMGAEANPGQYNLQEKIAKVYRKLFSQEKNTLVDVIPDSMKAAPWLDYKNYKDVTDKYVPVSDVTVQVYNDIPFAYMAVYNDNDWQPIHWGSVDSSRNVTFTDMGRNIAYMPVFYGVVDSVMVEDDMKPDYGSVPAGSPFILSEEGDILSFDTDILEDRSSIDSIFVLKRTGHAGENNIKIDSTYTWYVWAEDDWQEIVDTTAVSDSLIFDYYFPNSLYKVEEDCLHPDPRIFTIQDGEVIFW